MAERILARCPEGVETPGKEWWEWPECGWFLSDAWSYEHHTQNGVQYTWGGTCKRHGEVSDGS